MSSQQGSQRLGKYELRERLGRGGMAEVWKAFDTQLHRYVAIKILHTDLQADPEFITRFAREARVIASLHHPNIVQIHDFQTTQLPQSSVPIAYMVMDYVEGQTLAHYIGSTSRSGKFPPPIDIVHLFTSISKAIDYAHRMGMVHRDIKPANILLDKRNTSLSPMGEPVLTDFGIARLIGASSATLSGMLLGTPAYISPEQAQGQPGNERSDIYSLGVILYEICSGVPPFRGESTTAITWQHIYSMPTPPTLINPTISPPLAQVILRALAKEPVSRFSSASAMTVALAEAFHLPVPPDLPRPAVPSGPLPGPTYSTIQHQPVLDPPPMLPYPPPPASPGSPVTPLPAIPVDLTAVAATRKVMGAAPSSLPPNASGSMPTAYPSAFPSPSTPRWRRKGLVAALIVIVLFLLASSTIGTLYLSSSKHTSSAVVTTPPGVGEVYFLSSGQVNALNSQGVDDQVQVNLHSIPNPAPGKSYYAWLSSVPIGGEGTWTLLGTLRVSQGTAQFPSPYQDPRHSNLLLNASSFLVTEESSTIVPVAPSTDRSAWRFYSDPPQLTLLHLRHLLANSPELDIRQLYGGLGIWFLRNTEKLVEWASSARDTLKENPPDTYLIHRQIIHILDYIDGEDSVSMDVPPGTPLLVSPHDAQVALVGPSVKLGPPGTTYQGEVPPGYVYLMPVHLDAAVGARGATAQQHQFANQINSALNQVRQDLERARQDGRHVVTLSGAQFLTPVAQSYLNDLVVAAQSAYAGPTDPTLPQGGAYGIYQNLQRMATFAVQSYTA